MQSHLQQIPQLYFSFCDTVSTMDYTSHSMTCKNLKKKVYAYVAHSIMLK